MKKYWPVLSLAVISLIGLSIYYIDMAKALSFEHDFTFETLAGDEAMLQDIVFETGYQQQRDYRSYYIQNGEAQLVRDDEFYYTSDYELLQLFKEHKSFFRAKLLSGRHLYNDEQTIAYVYIDDEHHYEHPSEVLHHVALYDKKTKEQQQYNFVTATDTPLHWQTIEWVYMQDGELMTLSVRNERGGNQSVILTTYDIQNETAEEEILFTSSPLLNIRFNHSAMTYNTNGYASFDTYHTNSSDSATTEALYVFDAQTKALTNINKPTELQNPLYDLEDKRIVAYQKLSDIATVALYDIEAGMWQEAFQVPLEEKPLFDSFRVQLLGDQVYIFYQLKEAVITIITDINGNILYKGQLTVDDVESAHSLYVHRVYEQ